MIYCSRIFITLQLNGMLDKFEIILAKQLDGNDLLSEAKKHLFKSKNAKRVRPRFLFACGKLLNIPEPKLFKMACAVELIHTASLLHDDIVDNAMKRRKLPSVNAKFGNNMALLAGDQLLARALLLLADTPQSQKSVKAAAKTLLKMSDAVALEENLRNKKPGTNEQLLSIADGKTGALFALCGSLAGYTANDNIAAEKLSQVGNLLGRIFQINDDIDDLKEDKEDKTQTLPQIFGTKVTIDEIEKSHDKILKIIKNNFETNSKFIESLNILIRK